MLAVTAAGALYAWGHNQFGQLGFAESDDVLTPRLVDIEYGFRGAVRQACAGMYHSVVLTEHGEVFTMGANEHGQLGQDADVHPPLTDDDDDDDERVYLLHELELQFPGGSMVAGYVGAFRLPLEEEWIKESFDVHALKYELRRLGSDTDTSSMPSHAGPAHEKEFLVGALVMAQENHYQGRVVEVAAGAEHTLARTADGKIYSWGSNEFGQLGHGDAVDIGENQMVPKLIEALDRGVAQ